MELNSRPLWEDDQVITDRELALMHQGLVYQYKCTKWWNWIERLKIRASVGCINAMISWMKNGKPVVRLQQGE